MKISITTDDKTINIDTDELVNEHHEEEYYLEQTKPELDKIPKEVFKLNEDYTGLATTDADREEILRMVQDNDIIGLDTETTGLRPDDKIVGICISAYEDFGWYIPTMLWDGEKLVVQEDNDDFCRNTLIPLLQDKKLIMHNV